MKAIAILEKIWRKSKKTTILVLGALFCIAAIGNFLVQKGAVVDHPIRDQGNLHIAAENAVKSSNINLSVPVSFYLRCYPHITRDHLLAQVNFVDRAEKYFNDRGFGGKISISSLRNLVDYHDDEDLGSFFISSAKLDEPGFNARNWARKTLSRVDVEGGLGGVVPGEYEYFRVDFLPEQDFAELEMYRLVRAFLTGRELSFWELYLDPELEIDQSFFMAEGNKVNMTIEPFGWPWNRGEIDIQSNADTWLKVFGGIMCFSAVLLLLILLPMQALVSLTIIVFAFLTNRALIGIFDQFCLLLQSDNRYLEDVFSILNAPASLIAGFSFPLRSFYKFNVEVKKRISELTGEKMGVELYWSCWRNSFVKVLPAITIVAFVAIFDYLMFMGLQQFHGSRSMWQVAVFSSTGLLLSYFLTAVVMPPLYLLIGGRLCKPYLNRMLRERKGLLSKSSAFVDGLVGAVSDFFIRGAVRRKPIAQVVVFSLVLIVTMSMLAMGLLVTDSKPEELLDSLPAGATARELRKPGRPGFNDNQDFIKADLTDPAELDKIWDYANEMKKSGRTMFGPMNFFVSILERDVPHYHRNVPIKLAIEQSIRQRYDYVLSDSEIEKESKLFAQGIWQDILDQRSTKNLMRHMLSSKQDQLMVFLTFTGQLASDMEEYVNLSYAKAESFNLDVKIPSKLPQYAQVDKLVAQGLFNTPPPWGMMLNDTLSQLSIFLIIMVIFWRLKKKYRIKINYWVGGLLVVVPFIFSSMVVLMVMMIFAIPYDIASASIRSITVSVAVDLPIFLILGYLMVAKQHAMGFERQLTSEEMKHEAKEVFVDYFVNSLAFILLVFAGFPTVHRLGVMLEVAMVMFYLATMWMVLPFMKYLVTSEEDKTQEVQMQTALAN